MATAEWRGKEGVLHAAAKCTLCSSLSGLNLVAGAIDLVECHLAAVEATTRHSLARSLPQPPLPPPPQTSAAPRAALFRSLLGGEREEETREILSVSNRSFFFPSSSSHSSSSSREFSINGPRFLSSPSLSFSHSAVASLF